MNTQQGKIYFDFRGWFEDQMNHQGITLADLAIALGETTRKTGRLLNNSDDWTARQAKLVGDALGLHWWDELVMPLPKKGLKTNIDLNDADSILKEEGEYLDRTVMVA